jgi:hypothetical protein
VESNFDYSTCNSQQFVDSMLVSLDQKEVFNSEFKLDRLLSTSTTNFSFNWTFTPSSGEPMKLELNSHVELDNACALLVSKELKNELNFKQSKKCGAEAFSNPFLKTFDKIFQLRHLASRKIDSKKLEEISKPGPNCIFGSK